MVANTNCHLLSASLPDPGHEVIQVTCHLHHPTLFVAFLNGVGTDLKKNKQNTAIELLHKYKLKITQTAYNCQSGATSK